MSSVLEITVKEEKELKYLAKPILDLFGNQKVILFDAPMGAGKTTLIKEICLALGSTDSFSSPTYSIINEYHYPEGKIFHFDLYRLKNVEELLDLGIEEYLDSYNYCFFEWPELIENMIKGNYKRIEIEVVENIRYIRVIKK
ncbi:MAG: tRNA (adenosine(37)-N6)-threonylcarbamoyltransferase complex ATPase subunit type 1 TsaE [Bacteroidota bacterium]|nr:tRNA (adenosine(37)-N6)-threonylcarbamoyltransferase complex ATPase subunit type 1 TsaE [Bacteroidota bacterium]MDP3147272.1 tRNA (adenosine(37)-N6)-threonylcarbamoyltransferase complex ATPase subunit type 1 TsaE [Bacteroidota bacterium]MDP3557354.1 tRNA (adenosine(37)-N6)-threonylcarbamoyltransferase complex ATPase subunit type 1 TsaE [Bacteroidota bacterium]